MDKIRNSSLLKMISYILIPILVAILGFSVFHLAFLNEYGDIGKETEYIQSEQFANNYFYSITNQIAQCEKDRKGYSSNYIEIEESNGNVYYYCDARQNTNYYMGIPAYMNYIIIHKETKKMYTNIKSNDYQKEMENMRNNKLYWNLVEGKIETNLEYLNPENIKYNYNYVYQISNEEENGIKDYDVYTSYDNSNMNIYTAYGIRQAVYEYMLKNRNQPIHRIIISTLGLVAIAVYLFWAIGHKEGTEEIDLNSIDNIPYEIVAMSCLIIISIFLSVLVSIGEAINYMILFVEIICYFVCYAACAIMGVTTIKRIKAKQFWRSFLTYKIIQWCWDKTKKLLDTMKQKATGSKKIFWYYIFFLVMSVLIMSLFRGGIAILLLGAFWIGSYYQIKKYGIEQDKIKNALKNIYEGKTDIRLNEEELTGVLKEMAIYVNDIAGGFRNAIQERLKTELITNVSHDIKTPLTSIINYVDLLKKEEIPNEKIKEYIEILNQKSQRLKKLTEDLVEASKVSSGNVKLEIEEIDIKELLNQTIGEFKDKFENKKLKIEMRMPESPSKIKADNRYMYRVIENLFSNITKYALDGSRVYIDIKENNQLISICIKNISKDKLNISSDELMQRFVRGDKSRYTEGSGLGLSIAKSLTQLQGGKFDITIDGDLFRVDMEWKKS